MKPTLLQRLLGGRPMHQLCREGFYDRVDGRKVNYWIDGYGRKFMAYTRWGWFRVQVKEHTNA